MQSSGGKISLWSEARYGSSGVTAGGSLDEHDTTGWRSRFQQDYDRLLFSTPVRRLSDKTQVWPMEQNDGIRTRLTHSHEVANLARSIGSGIAKADPTIFDGTNVGDVIQPILLAIGLAHDLGNPPFGHQGEAAMGRWFEQRSFWIFTNQNSDDGSDSLDQPVPREIHPEFTSFDGNPQSLRLVTKLQTSIGKVGLGLTAATLTALLKYPVDAARRDPEKPVRKKVGYFESERAIVEWARNETGLAECQRHPLTWIMEACDDIAYSVLDVEDAMKKGVVSPDDVLAALSADEHLKNSRALTLAEQKFDDTHKSKREPAIQRDIKIGYLRTFLIDELIRFGTDQFLAAKGSILKLTHETPLMDASKLCSRLKDLASQHAFSNPSVLRTEALGAKAIDEIMCFFWRAISERKKPADITSKRTSALAKYGFSLISPNYIEDAAEAEKAPRPASGMRYRELCLLTDMVSGMTDTFAIRLADEIRALEHG